MGLPVLDMLRNNLTSYLAGNELLAGIILLGLLFIILIATRVPIYVVFFVLGPVIIGFSQLGIFPLYIKAIMWIIAGVFWFIAILMIIGER